MQNTLSLYVLNISTKGILGADFNTVILYTVKLCWYNKNYITETPNM